MYDDLYFPTDEISEETGEKAATPKDGLTQLKGSVEHIIFCNEDNG